MPQINVIISNKVKDLNEETRGNIGIKYATN